MNAVIGGVVLVALVAVLAFVWRDMTARDRPLGLRVALIVLSCLGSLGLVAVVLYGRDRSRHPRLV